MPKFKIFLLSLFAALAFVGKSFALVTQNQTDKVDSTFISESVMINNYQPFEVLIKFEMKNGWHIFAQDPGDIGRPTQVEWNLPEGYKVEDVTWSRPERFETDGIVQYGYAKTAYYRAKIVPVDRPEPSIELGVDVSWLACKDECIPEKFSRSLRFKVTKLNPAPSKLWREENQRAEKSFQAKTQAENEEYNFLLVLLMAFGGGLILNFMPCIFPILTIKAISLVQSRYNHRAMRVESLLYLAGVVASFLIVASILVVLRAQGEHIGWGFQLQSPIFVSIILIVFVLVFLMLLDVVNIRNPFANKIGRISMKRRRLNAFVTGFFAVLIASPCTAPFMGIAIGYTLTQPVYIYYPVFLALSIGYALPFTMVGFFPKLLYKILPKPGKWMAVLKRIFAVPVFLTCVWLIWLLHNQTNVVQLDEIETIHWEKYNSATVDKLVAEGKPVFIDFTAKWCITCLANERFVLQSQSFAEAVKNRQIRIFKADWTNEDPEITMALAYYGRNSIPLYVYYDGKNQDYKIMPQILTGSILDQYLK